MVILTFLLSQMSETNLFEFCHGEKRCAKVNLNA